MDYNFDEMYKQLVALKEEYPNIILSVTKKERGDCATVEVIERGFAVIGYGKQRCNGFCVSLDNDYERHFEGKYFPTAEEAFGELSLWMHMKGYRFKKIDFQKVQYANRNAVTVVPIEEEQCC